MEQLMKQMEIVKSDGGMYKNFVRFGDLFDYENKSKIKAGEGLAVGEYPFYTSSSVLSKFLDDYTFDKTSLIFGTGGNASIHYCESPFSVSTDCLVVFAKDETICFPKFVFYYLFGNINLLEEGFKGAGLKHISKGFINDLEIPLPPLHIQKRIAEILDAADALKRKDQELLKKYDELAQAIFIDMFGDPVKNEKGWEVKKLGELFSSPVKCGPFGSALKKEEYVKDGIPVWIMDNIQDYNFNENGCLYINEDKYLDLTSYSALKGDIIISRAGTVGKMCVVDSEFKKSIISTNLIKISLDEKVLNPYFFVKLMNYFGKKIGRLRTGSENGFTHMNTGVLAGLEFPLPSITKQNEYINVLKNINYQIQFLGTKPESLFQTLIQKAFKGELVK